MKRLLTALAVAALLCAGYYSWLRLRPSEEPEDKPAVWLQAAIHGNEISTVTVALYVAWQLAANPEQSRTVDRLMRDVTVYVLPVMNPDGFHRHTTEASSPWDNRANARPLDSDRDGRIDEEDVAIEDEEGLYVFNERRPLPAHAKKTNDDAPW